MDISRISQMIGEYRRLTEMSSLPFILSSDEEATKIAWFNFFLDEKEDEFKVSIRNILITTNGDKPEDIKANIKFTAKTSEYEEPELDEDQYLSLLVDQFQNCSYDKTMQLLSKAEYFPLLIAYTTVITYLKDSNII